MPILYPISVLAFDEIPQLLQELHIGASNVSINK